MTLQNMRGHKAGWVRADGRDRGWLETGIRWRVRVRVYGAEGVAVRRRRRRRKKPLRVRVTSGRWDDRSVRQDRIPQTSGKVLFETTSLGLSRNQLTTAGSSDLTRVLACLSACLLDRLLPHCAAAAPSAIDWQPGASLEAHGRRASGPHQQLGLKIVLSFLDLVYRLSRQLPASSFSIRLRQGPILSSSAQLGVEGTKAKAAG